MTLDTLRDDLAANRKRLDELYATALANLKDAEGVVDSKQAALLEFVKLALADRDAYQEAILEEMDEIDGALEDIFERNQDQETIFPETAKEMLTIILGCEGLITHLRPRLKRENAADKQIALACADLQGRCAAMKAILDRITVTPSEESEEDEEEDADAPSPVAAVKPVAVATESKVTDANG